MRCKACDFYLTDDEAVRKSQVTHEYLDMCNRCLGHIAPTLRDSIDQDDPFWDEHGEETGIEDGD